MTMESRNHHITRRLRVWDEVMVSLVGEHVEKHTPCCGLWRLGGLAAREQPAPSDTQDSMLQLNEKSVSVQGSDAAIMACEGGRQGENSRRCLRGDFEMRKGIILEGLGEKPSYWNVPMLREGDAQISILGSTRLWREQTHFST